MNKNYRRLFSSLKGNKCTIKEMNLSNDATELYSDYAGFWKFVETVSFNIDFLVQNHDEILDIIHKLKETIVFSTSWNRTIWVHLDIHLNIISKKLNRCYERTRSNYLKKLLSKSFIVMLMTTIELSLGIALKFLFKL